MCSCVHQCLHLPVNMVGREICVNLPEDVVVPLLHMQYNKQVSQGEAQSVHTHAVLSGGLIRQNH